MELELGLGISNTPIRMPSLKELDLISHVNSTLSTQNSVSDDNDEGNDGFFYNKKRDFCKAIEEGNSVSSKPPKTLPLLLWDKDPNEEEDRQSKRLCKSSSFSIAKNDGDGIVGWPPIKSYRKKVSQQIGGHHHGGNFPAAGNGGVGGGCGGSRSMYVKVQMEGFFITRKIDLKVYDSYESLTCSLLTIFGKGQAMMDCYKLTYQDREGDWLLAGDVPWRTFIQSVRRLKLVRRDDKSSI